LQRQNSNEDKEDTRQLSRGQNLNSQENSNHQNLRSTTHIDDRKVQHDPRYGMTDNENKQVPVVRGASEVLSSFCFILCSDFDEMLKVYRSAYNL
jgi:hypothetical protein